MSNNPTGGAKSGPVLDEVIAVKTLQETANNAFLVSPNRDACGQLADFLGLNGLRKLRFQGEIAAEGSRDWRLEGKLGASIEQSCVVTNQPVHTRIDVPVSRLFLRAPEKVEYAAETEFDGDDISEPLGPEIDLGAILIESLALAIPEYPRRPDAELTHAAAAPPGSAPIEDADTKPFASLAALRDKLDK